MDMDPVARLKSGFEDFKVNVYNKKPELFEPLKEGQAPTYMVFGCADSRCCPSVTLGLQPGEAFTMRNIASMVGPYDKNKYTGTGSAIEYAVCALKVSVIVVIGHSRCGGIKALLSMEEGARQLVSHCHFVEDWVRIGLPAKRKVQTECKALPFDAQCSVLEKEAVNVSLDNLKTYPFVKEGVENGSLKLVGAHYDFVNGKFETWDAPTPPPSKAVDAVARLKTGFQNFKIDVYDKKPELFEPLKEGQAPTFMVFACADSRCCPSVTLRLQPGEAFTIRNIASMVGPYDKTKYTGIGSAIEYAVCALKVSCIVVIGHSRCGGIRALLSMQDGAPNNFHFVEDWVKICYAAKKKVQIECKALPFDDQCSVLEREAVNVSLDNLMTYPFVKEGVASGKLKLVGGHYDFVNGKFETWTR
ncbi:hypothetical protein PR202_gb05412 [Eleusine coracana subsp. coracana]|uniref:carbonic anhydrase n=1 Tax=Eleusine coracana subsp. coracana TaxID=191504 RepID=A0AAV5E4F4_ELECO|nr:hypothetical protein PR202_gb05412 [Eleusine coracana subsp. coracana]